MDKYLDLFDDRDDAEDGDEDVEIEHFSHMKMKPHDPIYEEFEISEFEIDNNNTYTFENGKWWAPAKYKNFLLKNFKISEDMVLYSYARGGVVPDNAADMRLLESGERSYVFTISGKTRTINLKDILASSFLKTPANAVIAQYRSWNKDNTYGKYYGQKLHYTNLRWLTEDDFVYIGDPSEQFKLSKQGDIYTVKRGFYRLLKEINKKNQLRRIQLRFVKPLKNGNLCFIPEIHLLTALMFVKKPDESYKFVVHKDGDISNNHYRNLIWLNTLSGIYNDGIMYYEIPGCPGYVISETNVPYSFKRGLLKMMKLQKNKAGYVKVKMITVNNKRCEFLFHRVVAATRNSDFDPELVVDHIDRNKNNYHHTNLRSITIAENAKNKTPYKMGKEILQIDDFGNIITEYENADKAVLKLGEKYKRVNISVCANKNERTNGNHKSGDFIWKYKFKREIYKCLKGEYFKLLNGEFQGITLEYDNYAISNYGTIINVEKGYKRKYKYDQGYPSCSLSKNNTKKTFFVHVLVALLFVKGKTDERNEVHHINENITDFNSNNLQWVTRSENQNYSKYKNSNPVKKICMETGNVLQIYNSSVDAALEFKGYPSNIRHVCGQKPRYAYGYYWEYVY